MHTVYTYMCVKTKITSTNLESSTTSNGPHHVPNPIDLSFKQRCQAEHEYAKALKDGNETLKDCNWSSKLSCPGGADPSCICERLLMAHQ